MKGLKKLALATAVAAAPFAQAMESLDDSMLADMTGQAGITIDVNLDMTIDAIKYVDQDGNAVLQASAVAGTGDYDVDGNYTPGTGDYDKVTGGQGAITMKSIMMGSDNGTADWDAARIAGITIDADGSQGLVMGLNQIGDELGNGIDIRVGAVIIGNGNANLNNYNTVQAANAAFIGVAGGDYVAMTDQTASGVAAAVQTQYTNAATSYATDNGAAFASVSAGLNGTYANAAEVYAAAAAETTPGDASADLTTLQGDGAYVATNETTMDVALNDAAVMQNAAASFASAGAGNVGGIVVEDFRNYIQDDLVNEYNGVFDMALKDSEGVITGVVGAGDTNGRFVRGEIVINGTGNAAYGTSGLRISGKFGGAMDRAAWVDDGGEFGVKDMGFFAGIDTDNDTIADTIEGMHFQVDIDVVDNHTSSVAGTNISDSAIAVGDTVSALRISNMAFEGTIMMGEIYVGNTTTGTSLGSVLIKDIDMTGTEVFIYGH